jgi:hypothetical protein
VIRFKAEEPFNHTTRTFPRTLRDAFPEDKSEEKVRWPHLESVLCLVAGAGFFVLVATAPKWWPQ